MTVYIPSRRESLQRRRLFEESYLHNGGMKVKALEEKKKKLKVSFFVRKECTKREYKVKKIKMKDLSLVKTVFIGFLQVLLTSCLSADLAVKSHKLTSFSVSFSFFISRDNQDWFYFLFII